MEDKAIPPDPNLKQEKEPDLIITPNDLRFPLLAAKSQLCDMPLHPDDAMVVQKMKDLLIALGDSAVGLAGVQIGIPKQVFVMKRNNGTLIECINPTILDYAPEYSKKFEGCLSLPKLTFNIRRPKYLTLQWLDSSGATHVEKFTGLEAKIVCHEMDHLNGRTITYHAERLYEKQERMNAENKRIKKARKEKRRRLAKLRR